MSAPKDRHLKQSVKEIFEKTLAGLPYLIIDREVVLNFTDQRDAKGNLEADIEIDVVVSFRYEGKRILFFVECEDSEQVKETKTIYSSRQASINKLLKADRVRVLSSLDRTITTAVWSSDEAKLCWVYGENLKNLSSCIREAGKEKALVWGYDALRYYQWISESLGSWAKYEIFKDLGLDLEAATTKEIDAFEIKQKDTQMYVATITPSLLLKIGYVLRRASPSSYAYQRLIGKDRIASIRRFIASNSPSALLPNAIILVFDRNPEIQRHIHYHPGRKKLTIPTTYCSAWIIDGQHRVFGFINSEFSEGSASQRFDLPVVIFQELPEDLQTRIFIAINDNQRRIKSELLCDLATVTKDLGNRLTWPSLLGRELNDDKDSPLFEKVKISELHRGRPVNIPSLIQYGLLESLLGFRVGKDGKFVYQGPLYKYASFNPTQTFNNNGEAFRREYSLLRRFLVGVQKNTTQADPKKNPWVNTRKYALLKPTGINALFLVLAKILIKYPSASLDFNVYLKPLKKIDFSRPKVKTLGGGWGGFRGLANKMINAINRGKSGKNRITKYKD